MPTPNEAAYLDRIATQLANPALTAPLKMDSNTASRATVKIDLDQLITNLHALAASEDPNLTGLPEGKQLHFMFTGGRDQVHVETGILDQDGNFDPADLPGIDEYVSMIYGLINQIKWPYGGIALNAEQAVLFLQTDLAAHPPTGYTIDGFSFTPMSLMVHARMTDPAIHPVVLDLNLFT